MAEPPTSSGLDAPKREDDLLDTEKLCTSKQTICRCCLNTATEVSNMKSVYIGEPCCTILYETLTKMKMDFDSDIPSTICNSCTNELIKINEFISMLKNSFYKLVQAAVKDEKSGVEKQEHSDFCDDRGASDSSDDDVPLSQRFELVFHSPLSEKNVERESNKVVNKRTRRKKGRKLKTFKHESKDFDDDGSEDSNNWHVTAENLGETQFDIDNSDSEIKEDIKPFQCCKCQTIFDSYKDTEQHVKDLHYEETSCIICSENLGNYFALLHHLMVKHGKLKCCKLCLVSFKSAQEQIEHYKSKEHNTKCNVCGQQFKKRKALYEHRRKKHLNPEPKEQTFKCPECSKEFKNKNNIKRHVMVSHCDVRFLCDTCGQSYTTKRNLRIHIQKFHEGLPVQHKPKKKCFFCELCGRELKIFHKYAIALHRAKHKGHRHVCKKCYESFETSKQLKDHQTNEGHDLYKCDKCSAEFIMFDNFKSHLKNHDAPGWNKNMFATWGQSAKLRNEKGEYVCKYCPKVFKDKQRLDNHVRVHTNERPYKCHICSKGFKTWIHRKTHINIHLGIKKWVCKYCSKAFTNSCTLKGHEMIHTGERPHSCPECKKGFITISAMKRHRMVHLANNGAMNAGQSSKKENSFRKSDPVTINKDPLKLEQKFEEPEKEEEEETIVIVQSNQDIMFKYGQIFSGSDMSFDGDSAKDSAGLA